jgi:hypothetical protein
LPTGQILIDTTPEMHEQVVEVLDAISRYHTEPAPRVTLQYWVVLGTRDAAGATEMPPLLGGVLDEIRQMHGPLSFRVLGNASLVTESGRDGRVNGELIISQHANVQGTRLNAELMIAFSYQTTSGSVPNEDGFQIMQPPQYEMQSVEIDTSMERGEFVVVGENTFRENVVGQGPVDGTVFYIVHWPTD